MLDRHEFSTRDKVIDIVHGLLAARSIGERPISADDDLREIGLTSLDMVNLMLAVEAEFDLMVPERSMTPASFRSVAAIDALVTALLHDR